MREVWREVVTSESRFWHEVSGLQYWIACGRSRTIAGIKCAVHSLQGGKRAREVLRSLPIEETPPNARASPFLDGVGYLSEFARGKDLQSCRNPLWVTRLRVLSCVGLPGRFGLYRYPAEHSPECGFAECHARRSRQGWASRVSASGTPSTTNTPASGGV